MFLSLEQEVLEGLVGRSYEGRPVLINLCQFQPLVFPLLKELAVLLNESPLINASPCQEFAAHNYRH